MLSGSLGPVQTSVQGSIAQSQAGDEGPGVYVRFGLPEDERAAHVWLNPDWTSCDELTPEGEAGVVLVDRSEA